MHSQLQQRQAAFSLLQKERDQALDLARMPIAIVSNLILGMLDADVCKTASGNSPTQWDSRPDHVNFFKEAQRRGFSAQSYASLVRR